MLAVAIDTSIYKSDSKRRKPAFRALTRLVKGNVASLAMPFFVKREFVTKQQTIVGDAIKAISSAAATILDNTNQADLKAYAQQVRDDARQLQTAFSPLIESEFDNWLTEVDADQYPITLEQAENVAKDYFTGAPPFKNLKIETIFLTASFGGRSWISQRSPGNFILLQVMMRCLLRPKLFHKSPLIARWTSFFRPKSAKPRLRVSGAERLMRIFSTRKCT
jgi:hypothetical protein